MLNDHRHNQKPPDMTLSAFLNTLHETFEKSQTSKSSANGKIKFFPFLPCDNDLSPLSRGSFNGEVKKNEREALLENDPDLSSSPHSLVESEHFIEWTLQALKQLLAMPYLQFLR
jgi:hypothetical protein